MTQENFGEARLHLVRSTGFTLEADIGIPQRALPCFSARQGAGRPHCCAAWPAWSAHGGLVRIGSEIWQDDERKIFRPTYERSLGYVFQEASLLRIFQLKRI